MKNDDQVIAHYGNRSLDERVNEALRLANLEDRALLWSDLIPLDQFHVGGITATRDLAALLVGAAGTQTLGELLDVGCGLGGPTRFLASTYDCHVTGIDLTPAFVEVAELLTRRTGLADRIAYLEANALALPFSDESFDTAWTQHVAMNIADRDGLYASIHRVLKPDGLLAIYDIVAGDGRDLIFPVPWASKPEISYLLNAVDMRAALESAGFTVVFWADKTETYAEMLAAQSSRPSESLTQAALGLEVAMGAGIGTAIGNLRQNMAEGRTRLVQAVMRKG